MTDTLPLFDALSFDRPTRETLGADHAIVSGFLDQDQLREALSAFDEMRRRYESWASHVHLQFSRDTASSEYIENRDYADALTPFATSLEIETKRRVLSDRPNAEAFISPHVLALWDADITTFDDRIQSDLEDESRLSAEYTALLASARIPWNGEILNLQGLVPYLQSRDRETRHRAEEARWDFFSKHGETLGRIFNDLIGLRTRMARVLGFENYIALGYRRMRRTDYGPEDVAGFRERILAHVTPLVETLMHHRQLEMGWDHLYAWDEALTDPLGNPDPAGDYDLLMERAQTMFDRLDPEGDFGTFFSTMVRKNYLDLKNRDGKAGGGFCTSFPTVGMPYIFANFNGTHNDIGVFAHEMGHAYQNWKSRNQPVVDMLWPTMEAAEIHSMGLEFLTWPHIGLLVEEGSADRYRRMHLIDSLCFLPYGACVDHFQHEIYANPEMSPAERHATWRRLEKTYLPWRDWGDLAYPAAGGRWQAQMHIYRSPFYYIDYTLALCCALQLWLHSRIDASGTLRIYKALCEAGGSKPFKALVEEAGLVSPFETDALAEVVHEAEQILLGSVS